MAVPAVESFLIDISQRYIASSRCYIATSRGIYYKQLQEWRLNNEQMSNQMEQQTVNLHPKE